MHSSSQGQELFFLSGGQRRVFSVAGYQVMRNVLSQYGECILAKATRADDDAGAQADSLLREVTKARVAELIVEEAGEASCWE